ncbi:MAG: hypothetical protein R3D33_04275 [Hyphomicrobiaceae bacterium]
MASRFPNLFSPFALKGLEIRNRIFSTGHDTYLPEDGLPSEAYIAYQRARAKGGTGLIVVQVVGVHETARYTSDLMMGTSDDCIPHFRRLIEAVHAHGTRVFIQLFHPGREVLGPARRRRTGGLCALAPRHPSASAPSRAAVGRDRRDRRRLWRGRPAHGRSEAPTGSRSWRATATCRPSS